MRLVHAAILLAILFAIAGTLDRMYLEEVPQFIPCDTDSDCLTKNPHLGDY